jgi:hypothetical protein
MATSHGNPSGLHIDKLGDNDFQIHFTTDRGSMVFHVSVPDNSLSDAGRKSQAIAKLRRMLDDLHLIMNDDNASPLA